ncbi:polysaccharide pyruvyl transferase family protein [Flagellimonas marinaquae]|uniref:polysaccharide pyruvyl transferase family protein n=1 Tax=Flagellimonas aurea TaxID=2915619 RepID=UPI001CE0E205|nr:polysaccharide pyruvyl transferase family protein [Allomuricauda aquimarina]
MRIQTITCHDVYNYGASLQEYALLEFLKKEGHTPETINYKPPYLSNHFNLWQVSHPFFSRNILTRLIYLVLKLPKRLYNRKRKSNFDEFTKNYIPSTHTLYKNNEELKNNPPVAEAYICGSDQIWNSFFENGKDPAFYLDFVPSNKLKISYAASFAIDSLEENLKPFVKEKVSRLNHIAVRETSGVKILNDLGIDNVVQVLDPVFLLDKDHWASIAKPKKVHDDYIFIYDFDYNPAIQEFAQKVRKNTGYKIISMNELNTYSDYNYYLEGPEVFLDLVKNAKLVVANSFHAVAFSIIFQKEMVVFNRKEAINTRMRDLLNLFNIHGRLFGKNDIVSWDNLGTINYDEIQGSIHQHIEYSKNYLRKALNNSELN